MSINLQSSIQMGLQLSLSLFLLAYWPGRGLAELLEGYEFS